MAIHDMPAATSTEVDSERGAGPATQDPMAFQKGDLERLGRQRPETFKTAFSEITFCTSMLVSMLMSVSSLMHAA
jgi:hypothetical protein